ncbi:hypothetical protein TNCV_4427891 [Trichonephila clavipes]|nr:hypothetical protein TNCV_4427891 [Trichonephila clavipes]
MARYVEDFCGFDPEMGSFTADILGQICPSWKALELDRNRPVDHQDIWGRPLLPRLNHSIIRMTKKNRIYSNLSRHRF